MRSMSDRPPLTHASVLSRCPGCHSAELEDFFVAAGTPVDVGSLCPTKELALRAPVGDITLAYCHVCGLVWNRTFDRSLIGFHPGYDAGLEHSPLVQSALDRLENRLLGTGALRGNRILEVGCGTGYMLRRLCAHGNTGVGIDPTAPAEQLSECNNNDIHFIRDFYSDKYLYVPFDLLFCQSVLEDIPDLQGFLSTMAAAVKRHSALAYIEVFNGGRAFAYDETFSIHYEQCNYFTLESLVQLCERAGFRVVEAGTSPGNEQYLYVEAEGRQRDASSSSLDLTSANHQGLPETLSRFATHHAEKVKQWRQRLANWKAEGRETVVWGSGGKGVSFLNAVGSESGIRYVVDINPKRQGGFVPRSAQQVVSPDSLTYLRPDVVVVTNPAYQREIREQIAKLQLAPDIVIL